MTSTSPVVPARTAREGTPAEAPAVPVVGWRGGLLILAFWTLYGVVTTAGLLFSPLGRSPAVPVPLTIVMFLGAYTWAALTLPIFWLTRIFNLEGGHRGWRMFGLAVMGVAIAFVVSVTVAYLTWIVLRSISNLQLDDGGEVWLIARFRFLTDLLACLLIISAGMTRDYFLRYQDRQREASQLRSQLVESRLQFLRAQLNPHFLSNTMNAVSALVTKDPRAVRRMLARLSELLRYTLEAPAEPEVPLEQELAVLQQYLEILEIRFQGRLRTSIAADPQLMDALVPNLILQPLAENAMEHGVSQAAGSGSIEVRVRRSGDYIVLTVQDTGASAASELAGPPALSTSGGGYGLRHTRDRLEQLYGDEAHLELTPTPEGGMRAEVTLPFRTRPREPSTLSTGSPMEPTHA